MTMPVPAPASGPVVQFPDDSQRLVIVGRTGSGKTQGGMWHLSRRSWGIDTPKAVRKPWIICDTKGDNLIAETGATPLKLTDPVPTEPGLYVIRPLPQIDDDAFNAFLWRVWQRGNCGLYFDEGYMIPTSRTHHAAFLALLTQGRSKNIPIIVLSQRPVEMTRFVWSEADFFQVFNLNHTDDIKTVTKFVRGIPAAYHLPEYFSYYFDVGRSRLTTFQPVPGRNEIIAAFKARIPPKAKKL